ncbi:Polyketide synthase [Ophiocordyceps camponoti-floridani]|uniref:Polyketide synthase n=1 Tax=Ophiocordyceps camponoti-floridani TaxID=2030778 RepID=A0A8H4VDZ5_9HYPO|nr:Polyketide synthase [Ophiocordyceps camponoti-floridani]
MASDNGRKLAPVAVVGMSCRLPGGISTLDDFWTMLSRARSGWREIPEDRFSSKAFFHPNPQKKGCFNARGGYFMDHDLSLFDAPFFNITKQEAMAMDPKQRQLLECTYEALENAGISKESVAGSNMGVFIGGSASDYAMSTYRDPDSLPMFDVTGNHQSILSGRISHAFDLRGPCFSVDTACSSGLYALHAAVQSIRSGDCDSAVVAGCHLHLQPDHWVSMSMSGLFAEHGQTYAFDHRAKSGFARGEGVGCLILKSLDRAQADKDQIRSIIVNTGANQDGRTVGLSTPSAEAQEKLIRDVYTKAGVDVHEVGFIEAHGTGTKIGDPIEARAIYNALGQGRTKRQPLYMGSVKTNIGHLENASGIISVIKASLMLEKGFILPNINFEKANPSIPLDEWNIKVPTSLRSWPAQKRFISVNNFGFGGSNAHCILQRPDIIPSALTQEKPDNRQKLFVLSGYTEEAAKQRANHLGIYAEQHPEVFQKRLVNNMAYTLCQRRSHLPWRVAIAATCCSDIVEALNGIDAKPARVSAKAPRIAFVFTGQGAQWHAMGRELMTSHPVFADTMREADACLSSLGADFSLLEELAKDKETSEVNKARLSQPACTAVQLALVRLLASWGIEPLAVVGHSSGEIGAAFATGAVSLEDAMSAAFQRGQATLRMKAENPDLKGGMLAVGASPAEVRKTIKAMGLEGAAVACENSPGSTTVSGDVQDVEKLAAELESRKVFNRKLLVDVAYHSSHMELVAEEYTRSIKDIKATEGSTKTSFFSSLQGKALDSPSSLTAEYWRDNLVKPVLFSSALEALCREAEPTVLVEIGPHAALEGPIKQVLREMGDKVASSIKYCPTLVRNKDATASALQTAGRLFVMGQPIRFEEVNQMDNVDAPSVIDDMLPYPWTHEKYWFETRMSREHRIKEFARHDLLGRLSTTSSDFEHRWRNILTTDDVPWLRDHKMQSLVTFPFAGFIAMVAEAASQRAAMKRVSFDRFCLREVQITSPLIMNDGDEYEVTLSLTRYAEGTRSYSNAWDSFCVSSWTQQRGWVEHCRGLISVRKNEAVNPVGTTVKRDARRRFDRASGVCDQVVDKDKFYADLTGNGAEYGPLFRIDDDTLVGEGHSLTTIKIPDTSACMPHNYEAPSILSAAVVDMFFHLTFAILGAGRGLMPNLYMPNAVKHMEFSKEFPAIPGQTMRAICEGYPDTGNLIPADFSIDVWESPDSVQPLFSTQGFTMTPVNDRVSEQIEPPSICFKVEWEELGGKASPAPAHNGQANSSNGHDSNGVNGHEMNEVNGANGHSNGVNGHTNGVNGHSNGVNGHSNGANGHANGFNGSNGAHDYNGHADVDVDSAPEFSAPVVIISDNKGESDPLAKALVDLIALKTGVTPTICPLDTLDATDKICISVCELNSPVISNISDKAFDKLQKVILTANALLWVSAGTFKNAKHPDGALAQGLLRTVRSETSKMAATLDLDPDSPLDNGSRSELIIQALRRVLASEKEVGPSDFEFAESEGKLVVPRVVEDVEMNQLVQHQTQPTGPYLQPFDQYGRRLQIAIGTYGALDSLYFCDQPARPLRDDEVEVKIAATGMNFKDVVIAMGQVPSPYLGVECSGTISNVGAKVTSLSVGDRVCAMSLGAYGTFARCRATSAAVIPHDMSFETAASIPVVYSTAYYGMIELARLQPGESVLIHAASGGVGQAAIQLAHMIGAEIYATVGGADKKQLLMDKYGIPEDRIFYSRTADFGPAIREATGGHGVDVVLNSLAGELLRESWESLAHFGRFIEIGKRDITSNTRLDMNKFEHNVTFSSVDLTLVASERPKIMSSVLNSVMELMSKKSIAPIGPITVLGISELETALRTLQSGKSTGKLIISPRPGEQVKVTHRSAATILNGHATYIIIGGTGGLGRSMAKRMVQRGAKHIVLLSRAGRMTAELAQLSDECRGLGATITVKPCNVANEGSVRQVVEECARSLPPIRGVIHAAMVLRDMLFEKMSFDDFHQVMEAKVAGTWNFHRALSSHQLDFFIMLSSVAGIVGNRGQAAYAAANTFLDAFVQYRTQRGLPATSIDLTAVEDVGYLAENAARSKEVLKTLEGNSFGEAEVLALLEAGIRGQISQLSNSQCITGLSFAGPSLPFYADDARFVRLREAFQSTMQMSNAAAPGQSLPSQELIQASSYDEAVKVVSQRIGEKLCAILMLQPGDVDMKTSVKSYGLDSLNAIELRNWIGKEYLAHLQVLELLTSGAISDLAALTMKKSKIQHAHKEP